MTQTRLNKIFFARDTHLVAQELLGKVLSRRWRGNILSGRIMEVEAYVGEDDLACHAAHGRTPRTEILYGEPGRIYIYLIYGLYYCCNIVTQQRDYPAAVLIRSLEPLSGIKFMQQARHQTNPHQLTSGPGKLCQALRITKTLNNKDVTMGNKFWLIDDGYEIKKNNIASSARIGVEYAGAYAPLPWRYYLKNSLWLSR